MACGALGDTRKGTMHVNAFGMKGAFCTQDDSREGVEGDGWHLLRKVIHGIALGMMRGILDTT